MAQNGGHLIQYGGQMTTDQNMPATFFDPQMIYLQNFKSTQIHSNMHTQLTPAPRVMVTTGDINNLSKEVTNIL